MLVQHIATPFETEKPLYRTGIAVGDYPIDHHHKKNPSAPQHLDFFSVPSFNIPISCLIPENQDNIIIAEKSISVSNVVNGTTRLQPCVMQIGQAAGILAAQSIKENLAPKKNGHLPIFLAPLAHCKTLQNESKEKTLEEVGEKLNVTRERIRQIQNSALAKLRRRMLKEENFPEYFRKLVGTGGLIQAV